EKNTLTIEGVKADDVIQLQYIPSGDYTVTETGADGNKLFYNVTYPEGNEGGKVTVKEGENASLTVTNKPTENVFFKEWLDSKNAESKRPTPSEFAALLMPFKAQENLPKAGTACTAADFEPKPDALVVVQDQWDGMDTSKSNVYRIVVLGLPELEEGYSYYIGEEKMTNYNLPDSEKVFGGQFTYLKDGKETSKFYNIHNDKDNNILNAIAGYKTDFGTPDNPNEKIWTDNNNFYNTRPGSITLQILCEQDPGFVQNVVVKPDENGRWLWHAQLEKYNSQTGEPYTYYVKEVSVSGYTSEVSDVVVNEETGICFVDIENTLETVDVSVQKVWNDFDDLYACRPDTVSVQILQNEEPLQDIDGNDVVIELTEANGWAATVTGLPKYDAEGREAQYSVKEINLPAAYEAQDPTGDMIHGITLENVLKTVDVSVEKEWEHGTNIDLPKKIYVQLYADNISFGDPVELNNDNQWKHTWEQLPEYSPEGIEISYTVGEVDEKGERFVVPGYHQMISETGEHQFSILNTFIEPVSGQITATKTLNGAELKADQFTFELTGMDGAPMPEGSVDGVYTQKNDGNGNVIFPAIAYTSADMADAVDGKKIFTYTVREVVDTPVDGYSYDMEERTVTVTVTLNDNYVLVADVNGGAVPQFINSYAPVLTSATVKKIWEDEENQDGKRPETLTVTLSDGTEVELNEGNSWESTIENLPMYKDGEKIVYTWAEGDMPEGYTLTKTNVNGTITTLTNSYTPELTSATVKKIWEDEENQDGKRPETLTVTLSDGTQVELNEGNSWTATVENLPKYADGEEIAYTWTEDEVPEGYTQTGTGGWSMSKKVPLPWI
ncbi:MAG: Cna B-type domain-containing protein, partial [Clostridia bacterium]|nr:Cna B-type domain-containing protein [Clostridia bacterium]